MKEDAVITTLLGQRVRLCAVAWNVLRDRSQAEDLFQDTVVKATARLGYFENADHLTRSADVTLRNAAIDLARQRETRRAILDDIALQKLDEHRAAAGASGRDPDRLDALMLCAEQLPDDSRDLLHQRYTLGKSGEEIAGQLNISKDAVYQRLSRIHRLLRTRVEAELAKLAPAPPHPDPGPTS